MRGQLGHQSADNVIFVVLKTGLAFGVLSRGLSRIKRVAGIVERRGDRRQRRVRIGKVRIARHGRNYLAALRILLGDREATDIQLNFGHGETP